MKNIKTIVLVLLIILAIASGAAKVMKMPQEVEFFGQAFGLGVMGVVLFGAAQLLAALLMLFPKTRLPGALLLDITLIVSAAVLFINGDIQKGLLSIIPIVLNSLIIVDLLATRSRQRESQL